MTATLVELAQGTPEWLEWRRSGIGGSDAPAIMGVSPWSTAHSIWLEKTRAKEHKEKTANFAMRHGTANEPAARAIIEERLGIKLTPACYEDNSMGFPWKASLDGISDDRGVIVELKCPISAPKMDKDSGFTVPAKYVPQVQHLIAGIKPRACYYAEYYAVSNVLKMTEVKPDQSYIEEMLAAEAAFWNSVTDGVEPQNDKDIINMNDNEELVDLIGQFSAMKNQAEHYASIQEDIREKILSITKKAGKNKGGLGKVLAGGATVITFEKDGRIDYDKLISENCPGVIKDRYRKPKGIETKILTARSK